MARLNALHGSRRGPTVADSSLARQVRRRSGARVAARARGATTSQAANQEVRELAPKLLSELGDLASAVGVQKLDGMSRYLERFELTVQRIQQELNGLASGVSDAAPAAQRLADSLEFLNQVVRGLSGEESGLALSRVTGADAEQRLKTLVQRNQQFAAARAQGDRRRRTLVARRRPRRALLPAARRRARGADRRGGARAGRSGRSYKPWILGAAGGWRCCCSARSRGCSASRSTRAARPSCACGRTSATRRPSCGCWTSCRVSRTAT